MWYSTTWPRRGRAVREVRSSKSRCPKRPPTTRWCLEGGGKGFRAWEKGKGRLCIWDRADSAHTTAKCTGARTVAGLASASTSAADTGARSAPGQASASTAA